MANMNFSVPAAPTPVPEALGRSEGFVALQRDLQGVVARALTAARASGRDYVGQTEAATLAVTSVRPDLTPRQATLAVMWMRDHATK